MVTPILWLEFNAIDQFSDPGIGFIFRHAEQHC